MKDEIPYSEWIQEHEIRFKGNAPESIGAMLSRSAQAYGDNLALDFFERGERLTYRELDRQVSRLANGLRGIGVHRQSHVAVMLPNRVEFPVTWLALARMGAVMVPVNPSYTPHELEFVLEDADVEYIVADASALEKLDDVAHLSGKLPDANRIRVGGGTGDLGRSWEGLVENGSPEFSPAARVLRSDLLNIQYTSGTTGFPKGCMQTHQFWLVFGYAVAYWPGFPPAMSILGEAPFFYLDPYWMLTGMLVKGGTLHQAERYSSSRFWDRANTTGCELAMLPKLSEEPHPGEKTHDVKMFIGFDLVPELTKMIEGRLGANARELYGMTEIGVPLSVPVDLTDEAAFGTCGLPLPFYNLRIVDTAGLDVPDGQSGELWVKGLGVMDGYWNRPDANAESFVDGWFRTGDIFTKQAGTYYRFTGRIKEMIKRSGENIAAAEVEVVILQFPGVEAVAVVPVPDDYRDEEVMAVVKLTPSVDRDAFDPRELRAHCERFLAAFKCPRYVRVVDDFPWVASGSGKIAKQELLASGDLRIGSWDHTIQDWVA